MAPLTIALGPGFEAGVDVDYVIETMRGHNLGTDGSAQEVRCRIRESREMWAAILLNG